MEYHQDFVEDVDYSVPRNEGDEEFRFVASTLTGPRLGLKEDPGSDEVPFAGIVEDGEAFVYYHSRADEASIAASIDEKIGDYDGVEVHFIQDSDKVKEIFDYIFDEEIESVGFGRRDLKRPPNSPNYPR